MPNNGWAEQGAQHARGFTINGVTLWAGAGAPAAGVGADGDFYLRSDGTLLLTLIYHKAAGVWVGLT